MTAGIATILTRLRGIDARLGKLDKQLDSLHADRAADRSQIGELRGDLKALQVEVGRIRADVDRLAG